jgi:hypothetical protein
MRSSALSLAAVLLAACDTDLLSPTRQSPVVATARAAPIASLTATAASATQIDLAWSDDVGNETGWEVHRSTTGSSGAFVLLTSYGANVVRHSDVGLASLTEYCYKVRSYRNTGKTTYGSFSTTACATTPPVPRPAPPGITNVMPVASTAVQVDWDYSATSLPIRVERSTDGGGTWTAVGTTQPPPHYYLDTALVAEQPVCYRLIAFDGMNESLPSNVDCTTPPAAPSNITYTILTDSTYEVHWSDNSAVESGVEIWVLGYRLNEYFGNCYDETGDWRLLPANTTSVVLSKAEGFMGVAVLSDGGGSGYVFNRIELIPPPEPLCWG